MWYVVKKVLNKKYWLYILLLVLILLGQVATEILLPISLVQLTEQAQLAAYKKINTSVALANVGALAV